MMEIGMILTKPQPRYNLRKRSLAELDDVIEEIIERNPDFMKKIQDIIEHNKRVGISEYTKG